jgi:two-component system sensor kinase FixL
MEQSTKGQWEGSAVPTPPDGATAAREQALLQKDFPESVINMLPGSFFVATPAGRLLRWNRNLEVLSEYSAPEIAALQILDLVVEQHRERAAAAMKAVLERGSSEVEVDCRTRSGRVIPFYVTARRACVGGMTCLVGTGIDITRRKRAEEAYHAHPSRMEYQRRPADQAACLDITERKQAEKSLQELREIINRSPALVFLWRVAPGQWPVEFVSENVERALGYSAEDFMSGRVSWPGITHPDDVPRLEAEVLAYLAEGRRDWSQEYRLITRSGEIRWFQDQNLVLLGVDGQPARIQSIVLDVTERRRMADALCESERKYRDLYEGSRDGTAACDLTGRLLHANSVFLDMLGYTSEEISRLTYRDLTPARWHAGDERIIHAQVLTQGYSDVFEKEYFRKDGTVVPVEVRVHLSRDNEGNPIGTWALVRDITERKKAEAQAQQHLAELTRAWHANTLGEMASGLAHELNQPLCAILNYSNACLRLSRKEQFSLDTLRRSIEQITAQAQRAADIIRRIRGLTAQREPRRTVLNLERILNDAVQMLQKEISRQKVAVAVKVAHNLPAVKGDTVEIEQVVLNLLRNAIEAMSDARVTERILTVASAPTGGGLVEVAVADTGRGVAPELTEKIFESFFTTKREGLGVGLSLSRRIVEAHGGRLWVESDGASGATFRFTLPVEGVAHGEGKPDRVRGGR